MCVTVNGSTAHKSDGSNKQNGATASDNTKPNASSNKFEQKSQQSQQIVQQQVSVFCSCNPQIILIAIRI